MKPPQMEFVKVQSERVREDKWSKGITPELRRDVVDVVSEAGDSLKRINPAPTNVVAVFEQFQKAILVRYAGFIGMFGVDAAVQRRKSGASRDVEDEMVSEISEKFEKGSVPSIIEESSMLIDEKVLWVRRNDLGD